MRLNISARSSHLARLQAYEVGNALLKINSDLQINYFFRESLGDKNLTDPLWKMPEKGVFTEDFIQDLIDEKTDLVVHSWKDLPIDQNQFTLIAGTLKRADQRDLLLFKKSSAGRLQEAKSIRLLSSSQRRIYNLKSFLQKALPYQPDEIIFKDIRGNIPTRILKLMKSDEADGLILAKAALDRLLSIEHPDFFQLQKELKLSLKELQFMVLPLSENPNAAAQGALAIEIKKGRPDLFHLVEKINHPETYSCVQKERDILLSFGGGCHQKIGIAVLKRNYGDVTFLKGLTDQNEVLNAKKIISKKKHPVLGAKKFNLSRVDGLFSRIRIERDIPQKTDAIFVSRISAYIPFTGVIWTAGIETWKKLAAQNIWVNGTSESMGDFEDPMIDILCEKKLNWVKLTHEDSTDSSITTIATYKLKQNFEIPKDITQAENFFWMSSYQFNLAIEKYPELKSKNHCCGPGQTYLAISKRLQELNRQPFLFLSETDWRQHD